MNSPDYRQHAGFGQPSAVLFDEGLRQHMLRVYNYMALGLVLTGVIAFTVSSVPALYVPIFSTPLKWVVMLAPLAFVLLFSFRIQTMSAAERTAMFYANSQYPDHKPTAIAIAAKNGGQFLDKPICPCGGCRQALLEAELRYKSPIRVILYGTQDTLVIESIADMLPFAFVSFD